MSRRRDAQAFTSFRKVCRLERNEAATVFSCFTSGKLMQKRFFDYDGRQESSTPHPPARYGGSAGALGRTQHANSRSVLRSARPCMWIRTGMFSALGYLRQGGETYCGLMTSSDVNLDQRWTASRRPAAARALRCTLRFGMGAHQAQTTNLSERSPSLLEQWRPRFHGHRVRAGGNWAWQGIRANEEPPHFLQGTDGKSSSFA
jgi:hypothetical protein